MHRTTITEALLGTAVLFNTVFHMPEEHILCVKQVYGRRSSFNVAAGLEGDTTLSSTVDLVSFDERRNASQG